MWVFPPTVFDLNVADMSLLFDVAPFVFMFLIPAITMRQIAEEKKTGTIELLMTKPLSTWALVGGKYLASLTLVILALLPTSIFYVSIYQLGSPIGNIDSSAVIGSYLGLILLATVFTAVGILSSAMTSNQIIAFIIGLFFCFVLYSWFGFLADSISSSSSYYIRYLSLNYHYNALSKGVLDSRNLVYILSWTIGLLFVARFLIEKIKK